MGLRIAYLNSRYPALSHTFIEREVRMVREEGVEVHTFSIRRPGKPDLLGPIHKEEAMRTFYILDGKLLASALFWGLVTRPMGFVRAFLASQRISPPGIKARTLHLAYAIEAILLARELRRRGLYHVHVHMANNGAAVALLAAELDRFIRYSLTIHGSAEFFNVKDVNLKVKAQKASFVRCVSNFCRAQVMAWTDPEAWPRFHVVHTGLDVEDFPARPPARQGQELRILTVGRLEPIKGYHLLMEACKRLLEKGIEWRWDMVGDGPLRARLEKSARDLGLADRIQFSGAVGQDAIQAHFDRADLMVVSSFMEGVPVVLMEAMAKGLAVVSTNVAGVPELVDHGSTGLLVLPGSAEALADALERIASDVEFRCSSGQMAREKVARDFSIQSIGRQMAELFRKYSTVSGGTEGTSSTTEDHACK